MKNAEHDALTQQQQTTALADVAGRIDYSRPAWPTQATPEEITRLNAVPYQPRRRRAALAAIRAS